MAFIKNLRPAAEGSGFRMGGYFVWCGSPVRGGDGCYYLFASRWPVETGFPEGYMTHSEIVLSATDDLDKPFVYVKTVIGGRGGNHWDAGMAHNPYIVKAGGQYVLFYIGTIDGDWQRRQIGYATCASIDGEFKRCERPLDLPKNANNPAVYVEEDESCLLIFRDGNLKMSAARADRFDGKYNILNPDVSPDHRLEDPFVFKRNGRYEMLVEDADAGWTGRKTFGAHLVSDDGIYWRANDPVLGYTHTIPLTNGGYIQADRRERPALLIEGGRIIALFTAVQAGNAAWNCVQPCEDGAYQ